MNTNSSFWTSLLPSVTNKNFLKGALFSCLQACNRHSLYCVPLYDSLGENAIEFIISHSESTFIFVAHDKLEALLKALPKVLQWVKTVVYWGNASEATLEVRDLKAASSIPRIYIWLSDSVMHTCTRCLKL